MSAPGSGGRAGGGEAPGSTIERAFPLTQLQEGMLYHTLRHPGSGLYHGQLTATLDGALDPGPFREAWRLAARRHEVFRTLFAWERRPRPLQVVLRTAAPEVRILDWTGRPREERRTRWAALVERDRSRAFDLGRPPLMRVVVATLAPDEHELLWSAHHALLDGWSALLVLGEVIDDYGTLATGGRVERPDAPSYARFVGWSDARDHGAAESFWRRELGGVERPTPLPVGGDGPGGVERRHVRAGLSAGRTADLRAAARRMRVTPATLTVAAWALLLRDRTGDPAPVFGITQSERPAEIPGVERAAGLYLSTIPVRVRPPEGPVGAWLGRLQRDLSEARAHGGPGLTRIRRWSGIEGPDPIRSLVVFENFPDGVAHAGTDGPLRARSVATRAPSDIPLALLVHPGERLTLELEHDPVLVPPAKARRVLEDVESRLLGLAGTPATSAPEERAGGAGSARVGAPPPAAGEAGDADAPPGEARDVLERFEDRAREDPDAVALRTATTRVSYADLDREGARIAAALRATGARPGERVGVLAERSVEAVAGFVGVLKAGCAYVPLDPGLPSRRLASMARAADRVLAREEHRGLLQGIDPHAPPVVPLTTDPPETLDPPGAPPAADRRRPGGGPLRAGAAPDDPAYVIFTSGSTGEPKGVVVGRRQLAWSTAARSERYPDPPGAFLLLSPLSVDSSVAGLYWTLCAGGTLVLPEPRAEQDPEALSRLVEESGVTHTLLLPSLHRALLEVVDAARLRSLRWVAVAGERCGPDVVRMHAEALPGVPLWNEYGPTEATVWATVDELTADPTGPVTIGRPVPGVRIHLLDPGGSAAVPPGEPGEICIGGPGVALGYLGRPELTAARFVPEPGHPGRRMYRTGDRGRRLPDGRIDFLGRFDGQLKVRGFRVERSEVERALQAHPAVSEAAVLLATPPGAGRPDADARSGGAGRGSAGPAAPPEAEEALVDALLARPDDEVERLLRSAEEAAP